MKIVSATFAGLLTVLGSITIVSSCSKTDRLVGSWTGTPERIVNLPDAADAFSTISIDFGQRQSPKSQGPVTLSAVIQINQALAGIPAGDQSPYQANVSATAQISGYYMPEERSDDDYILSLDPTTLKVNIDPAGVAFTQNTITGTEQPVLDSLTNATVDHWRVLVSSAIREQFFNYTSIEDIKIHHSDIMSCEVNHRDLTFRRD